MRTPTPLISLFPLAVVVSLSACNFKEEKVKVTDVTNLPPIEDSELSFDNVKTKVLDPYCNSCHSSAANQGGLNLETFGVVATKLDLISERVFEKRDMPPSAALPVQPYALLKAWIDKGAPESAPQ